MHIFTLCCAHFSWKLHVKVVFIFSSKTSVLVWYSLKQAENEPKTTPVSDLRLSHCENDRFQKRAYLACFQASWIQPVYKFGHGYLESKPGILKKLSLAGLAKLSRLRCSWIRFGLASADFRELRVHNRPVYTAANSQLIPQSSMKHLRLARLAQLSGVSCLNFLTKTSASWVWIWEVQQDWTAAL